jgi:hypothetical protein
VRSAPSSEERNNTLAVGLRDFTEEPGEDSAVIKFKAPAGSAPVVEIGTEQPVNGAGGKLEFSSRIKLVPAEIVVDKNALQQVNFKAEITGLERETRYYYLVSTADSRLQTRGRFSTHSLTVKVTVVYTEIKVTNDSDDGGNGELFFRFFANYPRWGVRDYGDVTDNLLSWNDEDPPRPINEVIEISDAGDTLDLAVNGYDDDSVLGGGTGMDPSEFEPLARPFDRTDLEANVAKQTFKLRDFPGTHRREDFVLYSMPHGAGQGDLSFVVKGYFEIRRERN